MKITRMIALTTLFLAVSLFPSLALPTASAATASATATPTDPPSKIYRIGLDGKKQTLVAQLPAVHRASMSPSGRFVYAEKQGFTNNAPTIPYLYDTKTKQFSQLNGFAKWASGKDELLMVEQASLYRYNPLTKQKRCLPTARPTRQSSIMRWHQTAITSSLCKPISKSQMPPNATSCTCKT